MPEQANERGTHMGHGLLSKDDLNDLRDFLHEHFNAGIREVKAEMHSGFAGVHARQDVTNGRVTRMEIGHGEHGVRLTNVEREIFHRRRTDREGPEDEESRAITKRDLQIVLATLGIAGAVVSFIWKILPAIGKLLS